MNLIIEKSGKNTIEVSPDIAGMGPSPEAAGGDVVNLASIIEQNRAEIKRNWEELAKLDQILLTLNAREKGINARKSKHFKRPGQARELARRQAA